MATATDVVAPYWQVFEPPMIDKSTAEFEYVEYQQHDANQMDKPDGGQYTIETRDMDEYLLPHKAVLEVRGRLTKADGSAIIPLRKSRWLMEVGACFGRKSTK